MGNSNLFIALPSDQSFQDSNSIDLPLKQISKISDELTSIRNAFYSSSNSSTVYSGTNVALSFWNGSNVSINSGDTILIHYGFKTLQKSATVSAFLTKDGSVITHMSNFTREIYNPSTSGSKEANFMDQNYFCYKAKQSGNYNISWKTTITSGSVSVCGLFANYTIIPEIYKTNCF